jgi:uncharacterized protein
LLTCLTVFAAASLASLARAEAPVPDAPSGWVTDEVGFLTRDAAMGLDARLARFEASTGHQVLVYIGRTTGGVPIEDWAVRAFERWRVGRKGMDDGVVLFVFADDRRVRIEVGYGLEAVLPDARAARIVDEVVVPVLRAGRRDDAVRAGAEAVLSALGGAAEPPGPDELVRQIPGWTLVAGALFLVLALIAFASNPSLAAWLLFFMSARCGGDRSRRGGGFFGGGGRSGGGGASGSW